MRARPLGNRLNARLDPHAEKAGACAPSGAAAEVVKKIDSCQVAARPGEAGDKTKPERVIADTEDDRNCRGCSFGRQCGHIAYRGDHGHLLANQIASAMA